MKKIIYSLLLATITLSSQLEAMWLSGITRSLARNVAQRNLALRPTIPALSRNLLQARPVQTPRSLPLRTVTAPQSSVLTRPVETQKSLVGNPSFRSRWEQWRQSRKYSSFAQRLAEKSNWSKWLLGIGVGTAAIGLYYDILICDKTDSSIDTEEKYTKLKNLISEDPQPGLGGRPADIQAACDRAFEENKVANKSSWLHNGTWYSYGLVNLDEDALFEPLAHKNSRETDVYIIDAGCAQGAWGRNTLNILKDSKYKKCGKRFHIFSVTGGQECDELVEHHDHVTLYQFNTFKIENIDEEFVKRGFDLKNKVNMIVSHWTLRHLVDPFGTVKRMYGLLTPQHGMLLSNGFLFKFNETEKIQAFPKSNENIFIDSNAICLFKECSAGRDTGHFILMRTDKNELKIPLEYTGTTHQLSWRWQCASYKVTVFNKGNLRKSNINRVYMDEENKVYCDNDDEKCKNLYNALLNQNLFWSGFKD